MGSSKTFKIFTAISLPKDVCTFLHEAQKRISKLLDYEYRPVPIDNLHITLTYVGNVTEAQLEIIKSKLKVVPNTNLRLQIEKIEMPSEKRSRMNFIWAKVLPSEGLAQLKNSNDEALADFLPKKEVQFEPHITLFRLKKLRSINQIEKVIDGFAFMPMEFISTSFSLFSSQQHASGVDYCELAHFRDLGDMEASNL